MFLTRHGAAVGLFLGLLVSCSTAADQEQRALPKPLPNHPGNVFVAGEPVVVALPSTNDVPGGPWQLVNYEGATIAQGTATNGQASLGQLPVGYFELRRLSNGVPLKPRVTLGVLAPLRAPTPRTSPIGVDVAAAWLCAETQHDGVANLCALAGINWVRDRLSWGELEPEQGKFARNTKYDATARALSAAGLQVLQVHHDSPAWANANPKRQPADLRDAYSFAREIARRWRGQVTAFEPWNEGDIEPFGGHTGAELAAFQKASYFGLKAGNPEVIVCQNVFASPRPPVLADFDANEVWPYFDTFNLHHYCPTDEYPSVHALFRPVAAGRPMWVSEFARSVPWAGDENDKEPTDQDLRALAERIPQVFASCLHEGPAVAFYFILPHYPENQTQFGLLHKDLTPRPGYLALAAVGRLLADARPLGKLFFNDARAFAFRARPDGEDRDILVVWKAGGQATLELPAAPLAVFDHLGRSQTNTSKSLKISTAPLFAVFGKDTLSALRLEPPQARPEWKPGKPSPVVLQILVPKEKTDLNLSAFVCSSARPETVSIFAYNFSANQVAGKLTALSPKGWTVRLPQQLELAPGERKELALTLDCRGGITTPADSITIRGSFGDAGETVASLRLAPQPFTLLAAPAQPIRGAEDPGRWQPIAAPGSDVKLSGTNGSLTCEARFGAGDRWVYPLLVLDDGERPPPGSIALGIALTAVEGQANFRVLFEEENHSVYFADFHPQPRPGESVDALVLLSSAMFGSGWSAPDDNGRLDLEKIRTIRIGCNPEGAKVTYTLRNVRWLKP